MADSLERFMVEAVMHRLDSPALGAALAGAPADVESRCRSAGRGRGDKAPARATRRSLRRPREITWAEFLAARKPIEASHRRGQADPRPSQRASAAMEPYVGASSRRCANAGACLPLARQRAVVAALLDRAVVGRAVRGRTTFDEARVEPVWRV